MSGYVLFLMHGARVLEVYELQAGNERSAMKEAQLRAAGRSYELWWQERRITSFHAEDDISSIVEKAGRHPARHSIKARAARQE